MKYLINIRLCDANPGDPFEDETAEEYACRCKDAEGKQYYRAVVIEEGKAPLAKAFETTRFEPGQETGPLRALRDMANHSIRRRQCLDFHGPPPACGKCNGSGYLRADGGSGITVKVCDNTMCQSYIANKLLDPELPKVEIEVTGWPGVWEPVSIQKVAP